jgi:hypothetical protein
MLIESSTTVDLVDHIEDVHPTTSGVILAHTRFCTIRLTTDHEGVTVEVE